MAETIEIWTGLVVVVVLATMFAKRISVPTPILLVFSGLLVSFIPGLGNIQLNPDLALLVFLPLLVYSSAAIGSWQELQFNARIVALLSVGLVLFTAAIVALLAHYMIPGMPWAAAFVLGAIVSPPDDVAALEILKRTPFKRRGVTIIEWEALLNDATALTVFRMAVAAATTGSFSIWHAPLYFSSVLIGETVYGFFVGWAMLRIRRRLHDSTLELLLMLITPFVAYLPAEQLGGSGVLATVTAGLVVSWSGHHLISARTRLMRQSIWDVIVVGLNGLLFVLLGMQLRSTFSRLSGLSLLDILFYGISISLLVIVLRFIWMYPASILPRFFSPSLRHRDPYRPWQDLFLLSWAGMRGAISLAAALSIPLTLGNGIPFPRRNLIIFITFCVILITLIGQGSTLPVLIRKFRVTESSIAEKKELDQQALAAQAEIIRTGLAHLEKVAADRGLPKEIVEPLKQDHEYRLHQFERRKRGQQEDGSNSLAVLDAELQRSVLNVERMKAIAMRNEGRINDELLQQIEQQLDMLDAELQ